MPDKIIKARLFDSEDETKFVDVKIIVQHNWTWIEAPVETAVDNTPVGIEFHNGLFRNLSYMPEDEDPVINEWQITKAATNPAGSKGIQEEAKTA